MKTFAAVLCAMLATAGIALAHGSAGGGAVMSGGPVMMTPVATLPVFAPMARERAMTDRHRVRWRPVFRSYAYGGCRPLAYLPLPLWSFDNFAAAPDWSCGTAFVGGPNGLTPAWLMPAFMW